MLRRNRSRLDEPPAPQEDEPGGTRTWADPLRHARAVHKEERKGLSFPLWLLVLTLTIWVSVLLVTSAYIAAYALGGRLQANRALAQGNTAVPTTASAAESKQTQLPRVLSIPSCTPRPPTPTASASPAPTLEASAEPAAEEAAAPAEEVPLAEEAPAAEPTAEATLEPTAAPPTETPTVTPTPTATPLPNPHEARLTGVVTGGTIEVEYGGQFYLVRFQGIAVPNKDNADARIAEVGRRAEELTTLLVQGTPLLLEWDATDLADDGALLRYVFAGGRHIGEELVRQGLATVRINETDTKYQDALYRAQLAAQAECIGLWTCD